MTDPTRTKPVTLQVTDTVEIFQDVLLPAGTYAGKQVEGGTMAGGESASPKYRLELNAAQPVLLLR